MNFVQNDNILHKVNLSLVWVGRHACGEPHHLNSHPILQKLNVQRAQVVRQILYYINP